MKIRQYSRLHKRLPIWQSYPDALKSTKICHRYIGSYYFINFMFRWITLIPLKCYRNELGIDHYPNSLSDIFKHYYTFLILQKIIWSSYSFPNYIIFIISGSVVLYHKSGIPTLCYNVWKPQVFVAHSWIEHNHSLTSRAASCHGSASERKKNIFFFCRRN